MLLKRMLVAPALVVLGLALVGCNESKPNQNEEPAKLITRDVKLNDEHSEYNLKNSSVKTYFYENGHVPMVGIKTMVNALDGFYDASVLETDIKVKEGLATYSWQWEDEKFSLAVDTLKDTITVSDENFFYFVNETEGIDYGGHMVSLVKQSDPVPFVYDLKKYDFDTFIDEDDAIIPLNVFNTIFLNTMVTNIYYNQSEMFFYPGYLDAPSDLFIARNEAIEKNTIPADVLEARNNGLYFVLDYYYGLKDVNGIESYKDYFATKPDIIDNLLSDNAKDTKSALRAMLKDFNDPHTSLGTKSFYEHIGLLDSLDIETGPDDEGTRIKNMLNKGRALVTDYYNKFGLEEKPVRYSGTTAFIKFDSFIIGYDDDLYDEDGNVKPDAWEFDTYFFMKHCLDEIRSKKNITNVVIDLSTNGGGYLATALSFLGFLTNEDIVYAQKNSLTKQVTIETVKVDTDLDDEYTDDDAYTEFNYYILASNYTFSAANLVTSICKDMGIATIIGEKSGGGMCGVASTALIDGTSFMFSGTMCLQSHPKGSKEFETYPIENGIKPDYEIDAANFYSLGYLDELINNELNTK